MRRILPKRGLSTMGSCDLLYHMQPQNMRCIFACFAGGQSGKYLRGISLTVISHGQGKHFFHHVDLYGDFDRGYGAVCV